MNQEHSFQNIAVFGTSGAIGRALLEQLAQIYPSACIHAFSRTGEHPIDYQNEELLSLAAERVIQHGPIDLVLVSTGILHTPHILPEKSLKELSMEKFSHLFQVNTIVPALIAKHFIPRLNQKQRSIFAVLSARLGSISDNRLGGWYAYRASKAALNMIIKNAAIETNRQNKQAIIVGLHPGTVDSPLSKPFQSNSTQLLTPQAAASQLIALLRTLTSKDSGKCLAWNGEEILP